MADFAVHVKDHHEEGQGSWVLAVDGDKVLIAHDDDHTLHWYDLADCTLVNVKTPDRPTLVMAVQAEPATGKLTLAKAMPNRAERRRNGNN